jgi:hypothetical protein
MIQLATESTASRMSHRPVPSDGKGSSHETQQGRNGHAWPFLSRYAARPSQQEGQKNAGIDSGS